MDGVTAQKPRASRPVLIGEAIFANGVHLTVWQGRAGTHVRNETTGDIHRSNTVDAAWRNVRYIAQISPRSQRTTHAIW